MNSLFQRFASREAQLKIVILFGVAILSFNAMGQFPAGATAPVIQYAVSGPSEFEILTDTIERDFKAALRAHLNTQFDSLSDLIGKDRGNPLLYLARGSVRMGLGTLKTAKEDLEHAYDMGCRKKALFLKLGQVNYLMGFRSNAIAYLESVIKADSNCTAAFLHRGIAELCGRGPMSTNNKVCKESKLFFDRAILLDSALDLAYIFRGVANRQLKLYEAAAADLEMALRRKQRDKSFALLAEIYLKMGQRGLACKTVMAGTDAGFHIPESTVRLSCKN